MVYFRDSEELLRVEIPARVNEVLGSTLAGSTQIPNPRPPEFLVVRRIGGSARDLVTDVPIIQIEAWASKGSRAAKIATVVRQVVWELQEINGEAVELEEEITGPVSYPDGSGQSRYTQSHAIAVRGVEDLA